LRESYDEGSEAQKATRICAWAKIKKRREEMDGNFHFSLIHIGEGKKEKGHSGEQ